MNDSVVAVKGLQTAQEESRHVKSELEKAGFVVSVEKFQCEPSCKIEWLGFQIDLDKGEFIVPEHKICLLNAQLLEVIKVHILDLLL